MSVATTRPIIGAKDFVYALLNAGTDIAGGTPTYGAVKSLPGLRKVTVNPNASQAQLEGDDRVMYIAEQIGKIDVTAEFGDVVVAQFAELYGHAYANGAITKNVADVSPLVAIGYKVTRSGSNVFTYKWLYCGQFMKMETSAETKGESLKFQTVSLKGIFRPLVSSGVYELRADTDDTEVAAAFLAGFFSTVVLASTADLGAFTLTSAAGVASTKTITITFGKAGGGSTTVRAPTAANLFIILDSTHALLVPSTVTPGVSSTTPTVVVVTTSLTAAAHTIVVTADVKDANGVACVAKSIAFTPSA